MDRLILAIRDWFDELFDNWAQGEEAKMASVEPSDIYKRLAEDFRAMNAILWQIVPVMATATGALWYAVANLPLTLVGQRALLVFTALVNIVMILALIRIRIVTRHLQGQMEKLDRQPTSQHPYITVFLLSTVLAASAIGSTIVAFVPDMVLAKKSETTKVEMSLEPKMLLK